MGTTPRNELRSERAGIAGTMRRNPYLTLKAAGNALLQTRIAV